MKVAKKNLSGQVIVFTGATSGIGLATARLAGERGAMLVLAARNEDALKTLSKELAEHGVARFQSASTWAGSPACSGLPKPRSTATAGSTRGLTTRA